MTNESQPTPPTDSHTRRLRNGSVLLAAEELDDPNFHGTLILVCIQNTDGAFGLVCNHPSHMPLAEVFNVDPIYHGVKRSIYMGGPVDEEVLNILHITDTPVEKAFTVEGRVHLGGEWNSLESILSEDPSNIRMFLGYAGWHAGQLEAEIARGDWEVYNVDVERFLADWEEPQSSDLDMVRVYLRSISTDPEQ